MAVDREEHQAYRSFVESTLLGPATRVGVIALGSVNIAFILVDYIAFPGQFRDFLWARGALTLTLPLTWACSKTHPLGAAYGVAASGSAMLLALIAQTGGGTSDYYAGLVLLVMGVGIYLPFTRRQALCVVALILGAFLLLSLLSTASAGDAVLHMFFLSGAGLAAVLSCDFLEAIRFKDFCQREELEATRDRLQEMDRAKSRFTANIHHELRTPLTLILAPLAALRGGEYGEIPSHVGSTLKVMDVNGRRLHKLINNLLDLAKLESSQFSIERRPMDLRELAEDVVVGAGPLAERKGIELQVEGFVGLAELNADPDALDKVMVNLVGNALKFTEEGGSITVWAGATSDGGTRLEVRDTGIGIPPEQLAKVFDRFAQVDGSTTRKHEGTGIGLSLAHELVTLHGGRIWAESAGAGQGTTMCVELPAGETDGVGDEEVLRSGDGDAMRMSESMAAAEAELNLESDDEQDLPGPKTVEMQRSVERWELVNRGEIVTGEPSPHSESVPEILIAEDNPDMRKLLAFLLAREFRVRVTRNGREALESLREKHPYLVLTDVMMPEMSGTELCAAIKNDDETRHIPVVLVTSKAEREMKIEGLENGADDYVTKPFHPRELLARVRSLVRVRDLQEALSEQNASLERALSGLKQAQVQLVQNERLAAVGELAAGIAHEVNNPVNFALNASRTLRVTVEEVRELAAKLAAIEWRDPSKLEAQLQELQEIQAEIGVEELSGTLGELSEIISEGLGRTSSLVGDLRDFAAPGRHVEARVNLHKGVTSTVQLLKHVLNQQQAEVFVEAMEELPEIRGDSGALNQVFLNLLKNAAEASPGGGVTIRVQGRVEGDSVSLVFADDGPGVPEEVQEQLFEPFFTTKEAGQGTGLGLSISRQIAEAHGGTLAMASVPGEGSTFTLCLPIDGNFATEDGLAT